jgi:Bestrophin, RFP-TM, chloride channel
MLCTTGKVKLVICFSFACLCVLSYLFTTELSSRLTLYLLVDCSKTVSPERRRQDLQTLALCTWAFVRAMKRHLSPVEEDEEDFKTELFEKLPSRQAQCIIDAAHRPNRALQDLSMAIENLNMHFLRKDQIHAAATIFEDNLGSSERLLTVCCANVDYITV